VKESGAHVVVGAAELGAGLLGGERVAGGQPLGRALLGRGHYGRQNAAQLVAEGVERRGVVCDAERVQLAHKDALVLQLRAQRRQLLGRACTRVTSAR
jgi:hypothetical protein